MAAVGVWKRGWRRASAGTNAPSRAMARRIRGAISRLQFMMLSKEMIARTVISSRAVLPTLSLVNGSPVRRRT